MIATVYLEIAQKARTDFEAGNIDLALLGKLYDSYHEVPDPHSFVIEAVRTFPSFADGLAAVYLVRLFGEGEVVRGTYDGQPHTFVKLNDRTIADITADQFGGPPVYVGNLVFPWIVPI